MYKIIIFIIILINLNLINLTFICDDDDDCYYKHFDRKNNIKLTICIETTYKHIETLYISSNLLELFIQYGTFEKINKTTYIQECKKINKTDKTKIYLLNGDNIIIGDTRDNIKPLLILFSPLDFDIFLLQENYNTVYYIDTEVKTTESIIKEELNRKEIKYNQASLLNNEANVVNKNVFNVTHLLCEKNSCINFFKYCFENKCLYEKNKRDKRSKRKSKGANKRKSKGVNKGKMDVIKKGIIFGSVFTTLLSSIGIVAYISHNSKSFSECDWCNSNTFISCTDIIITSIVLLIILIFLYVLKFYMIFKK